MSGELHGVAPSVDISVFLPPSSPSFRRDPHVAVHGSFSFMTNFHAVRLYALARGGFSLHTPYMDGFKCSAFVLDSTGSGTPAAPVMTLEDVVAAADVTLPSAALAEHRDLLYEWADCME